MAKKCAVRWDKVRWWQACLLLAARLPARTGFASASSSSLLLGACFQFAGPPLDLLERRGLYRLADLARTTKCCSSARLLALAGSHVNDGRNIDIKLTFFRDNGLACETKVNQLRDISQVENFCIVDGVEGFVALENRNAAKPTCSASPT